jgi:hypothetical protein
MNDPAALLLGCIENWSLDRKFGTICASKQNFAID